MQGVTCENTHIATVVSCIARMEKYGLLWTRISIMDKYGQVLTNMDKFGTFLTSVGLGHVLDKSEQLLDKG